MKMLLRRGLLIWLGSIGLACATSEVDTSTGSGGNGGSGETGAAGTSGKAGTSGAAGTVGSTGGTSATGSAGTTGRAGTTGGGAGTAGGAAGTAGGAAGTAGGGTGTGTSGCGKTPPMTGAFQATIAVAGVDRGYFVSIPTGYDPAVPRALVFGYHGSNYTGRMMRTYLDMEKAPLVSKAIYIYPDGMPPADNTSRAWELTATGKDMPFFDAMLAKMSADYCVDPKRILVAGQSYGGLMTNAVGCLRGDVVRAIAAIAGSGPNNTSQCKGPVAAWIIHGMDDGNVSFESGQRSRDFWRMANGCATTTTQGNPMQCVNYDGCMPGYPLIWCQHVGETGHQQTSWGRVAVREFFASF